MGLTQPDLCFRRFSGLHQRWPNGGREGSQGANVVTWVQGGEAPSGWATMERNGEQPDWWTVMDSL